MINVAWLIASLIFFSFSVVFLWFAKEPIRSFSIRRRFDAQASETADAESKKIISEFLEDFEGYLKSINDRNKFRYRIASGGFLIAGLTALLLALAFS